MQSFQLVSKPSYSFIQNSAKRAFFEGRPATPKINEKAKNRARSGIIRKFRKINFGIFKKLYRAQFGQSKKISKPNKARMGGSTPKCLPPKQEHLQKAPQRLFEIQEIKSDEFNIVNDDSMRSLNNNYEESDIELIVESEFGPIDNFCINSVETILQPCRTFEFGEDFLTLEQIATLEKLMKRNIGLVPKPYRKPTAHPAERNLKEETALFLTAGVDKTASLSVHNL